MLIGDDDALFERLEAEIVAEINPQDILENLWCRDVVERSFDILRLRRWKSQFVELREVIAVSVLLKQSSDRIHYPERIESLVNGWGAGSEDAIDRVYEVLKHTDREHSHIEAQAVGSNLEALGAIENLLLSNEIRRDSIIREIERYRDVKAKRSAIEGGFKAVASSEVANDQSPKG